LSHVCGGRVMCRTGECRLVSRGSGGGGQRLLPKVVS
jgi:hypothetical protein